MSSFKSSNDIYEAYKIFKVHENNLQIAEDKFLNHVRNLFQYAEEKGKLDEIFHLLKNSE
ncbi:24352_t:CDS:1, partial [Gigaspora margarita]